MKVGDLLECKYGGIAFMLGWIEQGGGVMHPMVYWISGELAGLYDWVHRGNVEVIHESR